MTKTHMRREIEEIPEAVARLLDRSGPALVEAGRGISARDPHFVVTVARGSSDHAATFMKYAVELTAGLAVASVGPSVASIYGARLRLEGSACLAISQSGKSPDIVAMVESARRRGALTVALTNTAGSPLALASDHAIDILAGPERSVAATKSFVNSAVAGLALMAHCTGDEPLLAALRELPEHFRKAVRCDWTVLADALEGQNSMFVLGRGPSLAMKPSAASASRCASQKAARPGEPASSPVSISQVALNPSLPSRARNTARRAARLMLCWPLLSAVPRPYQRSPSTCRRHGSRPASHLAALPRTTSPWPYSSTVGNAASSMRRATRIGRSTYAGLGYTRQVKPSCCSWGSSSSRR